MAFVAGLLASLAALLASNGALADAASIAVPSSSESRTAPQATGERERNDTAAFDEPDERGFFERVYLGLWHEYREARRGSTVIVAKVRRVKQLMRTRFYQLRLDNGQTWRENGIQPNTSYRVGDSVVIYRLSPPREHLYDLRNQRTGQIVRVNRLL